MSVRKPEESGPSAEPAARGAAGTPTNSRAPWVPPASDAPRPEALANPTGTGGAGRAPAAAVPAATRRVATGRPATPAKERTVGRRLLNGRRQRFEARKVHRVIRHVDPWSVLKMSIVFFLCVWVMFMVAIVIVWSIAESSGTIGKIEDLLAELDITNSGFDGTFIFRQYGLFGLVMACACTIATTVGAIVFNLVSDLIGGVWITVIEEETARPGAD